MNVNEFLEGRDEMSLGKVAMLKYLEKSADKFDIIAAPKGRSTVKCHFDCGAYKGEEILTFRVADLNPIYVAAKLMQLTSGHHFSFKDGEEYILQQMERSITRDKFA